MLWIGLVLLYGILKGIREILKKKALGRNTVMEVLLMYTLLSFLILIPTAPKAGGLNPEQYASIFAKSFIKILAAIALLLAMCFAGYYIMNADKIVIVEKALPILEEWLTPKEDK